MTSNYSKDRLFAKKKPLLIMIYFLFFFSCNSFSKDDYLKDFAEFVGDVEMNYKDLTEDDWRLKEIDFQNYTTELYNRFKGELTNEDQLLIGKLKTKYLITKSKSELKNLGEQIKAGVNQIKGAIDEVLKDENIEQIKGAKDEILEKNIDANK